MQSPHNNCFSCLLKEISFKLFAFLPPSFAILLCEPPNLPSSWLSPRHAYMKENVGRQNSKLLLSASKILESRSLPLESLHLSPVFFH